ncbi:MerR family transcriptional regulator [Nocardioides speluncae]|uniref:MerR family transcriptional regulator n=1 Tax=Nocardioides speluncae TaxID=2670337 RepID=UPI000D699C5F|nr:MerR family transcriptional regulator [Nocardioides speluncae]
MGTYRISQLAERSGVPATTLRYYESAGLLPAGRTEAGYRVYDDASARRLEFISSAKALGLPLEEIRDLLGAWESGVCAHVRERMLPLVAQRMDETDRRRAELAAFAAQLATARAQLSTVAPAGACGPGCGCVANREPASGAAGPDLVELTMSPPLDQDGREDLAWRETPVACTLTGAQLVERTEQWQALLAQASDRQDVADGVRVTFPASAELAGEVAALAVAEQGCCAFFDFTLHLSPDRLELAVRAPEAAAPLMADLFGATQ